MRITLLVRTFALGLVGSLACATFAQAHRIDVLRPQPGTHLACVYADGAPVTDARVEWLDAEATVLGHARTDGHGRIALESGIEGVAAVRVRDRTGHAATATLGAADCLRPPAATRWGLTVLALASLSGSWIVVQRRPHASA